MGIHRNTKPYFLPSAKCAGCPKENVPVSLCGRRYYCEDCFQYDSSEYGSQAALGSYCIGCLDYLSTCPSGMVYTVPGPRFHELKPVQWEYQEVRFSSVRELDEFGKCGWEFFHIEAQAGGYRKALGKRLCST